MSNIKRPDLAARNKSLFMRERVRLSKLGNKRPDISGKNHYRWKGGRMKGGKYVLIFSPNHPFSDRHGYVREHRLVMEESIGRYLKPKEVVHHINGNHTDNRIENLQLLSGISEHMKLHHPKGVNPNLPQPERDSKTGRFIKS